VPYARLDWPYRQLLRACKYTVSYRDRIVSYPYRLITRKSRNGHPKMHIVSPPSANAFTRIQLLFDIWRSDCISRFTTPRTFAKWTCSVHSSILVCSSDDLLSSIAVHSGIVSAYSLQEWSEERKLVQHLC